MKDKQTQTLLVVGAGHLGAKLISLINASVPAMKVVAETKTTRRHELLKKLRCKVRLRSKRDNSAYDNVVFCLPPSIASDQEYLDELVEATKLWNKKGHFVFTSSVGVYRKDQCGLINENSPLATNPRASLLLAAENKARSASGIVLRLGGLYSLERGPQNSYTKKSSISQIENRYLNLIHYDDAATALFCLIQRGIAGNCYNATDESPVSSHQLCFLAVKHVKIGKQSTEATNLSEAVAPIWRGVSSRKLREVGWQVTHKSIVSWLDTMVP